MSVRKEIVFTARDENVASLQGTLRQSSNDTTRTFIENAQATASSSKEVVEMYEKEIQQLQQKQQMEAAHRQEINSKFDRRLEEQIGGRTVMTAPDRNEGLRNIAREYKDKIRSSGLEDGAQLTRERDRKTREFEESTISDHEKFSLERANARERNRELTQSDNDIEELKSQTILLKEIVEAVRQTSDDEVRAERADDNPIEISQQPSGVVPIPNIEASDRDRKTSGGSGVGNAAGNIQNIVGSDSVTGATGAGLGMMKNPYAAAAAAVLAIGTVGLQKRAGREMAGRDMAALLGNSSENIADSKFGATGMDTFGPLDLNVTREEFTSKFAPAAARSAGTADRAEDRALRQIEIDTGLGVSEGTGASLDRVVRVMEDNVNAQTFAAKIFTSSKESGAISDTDLARMEDIFQGVIGFQEGQLFRSGSTSSDQTLNLMSGLQGLGGNFQRDDYTFDTIGRLNSGLAQGGTPEAQAFKMDILRKKNPEMSFFELQAEMEKGIGSEGFLKGTMDMVKGTGGDLNAQSILFDQMTSGQMRKADILSILKGDMDIDSLDQNAPIEDPGISKRAIDAASTSQTRLDFPKEAMTDGVETIGNLLNDQIDEIKGLRSDLGKLNNTLLNNDR